MLPVHLSFDDHRIADDADVVHADVTDDVHGSRLLVDFDDRDVAAEREIEVGRIEVRGRLEAGLDAGRKIPGEPQPRRRSPGAVLTLVGPPLTWHLCVFEDDVFLGFACSMCAPTFSAFCLISCAA